MISLFDLMFEDETPYDNKSNKPNKSVWQTDVNKFAAKNGYGQTRTNFPSYEKAREWANSSEKAARPRAQPTQEPKEAEPKQKYSDNPTYSENTEE